MRRRYGFTLIELLVVLTLLAVLFGVGILFLSQGRDRARAEVFIQGLVKDINTARSDTMARGTEHRIVLLDEHSYSLERANTLGGWEVVETRSNMEVTLSGFGDGDTIFFDTRGFIRTLTSTNVPTTIATITASFVDTTKTIQLTALGLAREVL